MFAKSISALNPVKLSKRTLIVVATVIVLTIALFAVTPGVSMAGPATSPSACGTCAG